MLANVAGYVHQGTVLECCGQDWDFSFDLNVKSMHRTIKAFLPAMLKNGGGSIINMSSGVSSIKGLPNRYAYGATKAAVIGLTKAVAADFITPGHPLQRHLPRHHRVAVVRGTRGGGRQGDRQAAQGGARELSSPASRWRGSGPPQEVAALALFLASDESSYITGQPHLVDGGMAL